MWVDAKFTEIKHIFMRGQRRARYSRPLQSPHRQIRGYISPRYLPVFLFPRVRGGATWCVLPAADASRYCRKGQEMPPGISLITGRVLSNYLPMNPLHIPPSCLADAR
ncbi:hypothetical protein E2C01_036919 [Portunus trituberculatus]|uniref:Uncharacterized protein n=1 Tax=Portunus trituberculatus TaxID=210409 RepID=A0A5B7FCQ2_PORTR|nr:hypothetical protein [Portunus trituberculatus]